MSQRAPAEASLRTAVVAIVVNLLITFAKGFAAVLTGSPALWAETAHSLADSGNEVLLFVGLRRSVREADDRHPLGYGQERWFWAFLAALGIFVVGGVLSVNEGIQSLRHPHPVESFWVGIAVLVVSMGLEAVSWRTARAQLRDEARARGRSLAEHMRRASDPTAPTVFLEDSAALAGLSLAMVALVLHQVTGSAVWDASASIAIGLLLVVIAYLVARRSKGLLIDESAPPDVLERLRDRIASEPWVGRVVALTAVFIGPRRLLVTARVAPTAQAVAGSAKELVARASALRQDLLKLDVIGQAEVALTPSPVDGGDG
ncbi:MAG TPA: cation diffusion facilitator family transporter [Rugosimonospora sp.]|nr:cation diffusion facilitator family transporter [Rugosimonospora sp.]